ncbi:MAG: cold shock domain-containing protein [Chlorobium sp.]|jgi:CspA family cold shock protein|uniref:cold-shock protein n=1 Tax=Chlorobium sp. TaxID=1095 RepID=UPI001D36B22C|nr:cold shock domain-containing protein [Chlorobium sp.]MBN1278574.1 cold shock domain-containing protein [Chlorobiaceae bacterium]MCF8215937.1 cold shock domain-containing protein [Chlorobium sp.]MCF8270835.1 cold shock domain-containing protein [Chlorobium sp.]MCF8287147.1 cold shock domain-containing protein [Chlorobium sp.]MCF8290804.1 cold shock domain-containing protein [Chlorobium sp.]
MERSKVKWFDGKKGYGFILNPQGGEDVFVHFSAIVSEQTFKVLNQDSDVEFELEKTQKGYQAKNVRELTVPVTTGIPPSGESVEG